MRKRIIAQLKDQNKTREISVFLQQLHKNHYTLQQIPTCAGTEEIPPEDHLSESRDLNNYHHHILDRTSNCDSDNDELGFLQDPYPLFSGFWVPDDHLDPQVLVACAIMPATLLNRPG